MNRRNFPRVRNVILIGMPGSGKSSFGKNYAFRTGRQFLDFDRFVELNAKKTIPEIWQEDGEQGFRRREHRSLLRLQKRHSTVIAMGGGTLCAAHNFRIARRLGLVVFLDVPVEVLTARLLDDRGGRPMFPEEMTEESIHKQLQTLEELRRPFYECADASLRPAYSSDDCMVLELLGIENRGSLLIEKRRTPDILRGPRRTPLAESSTAEGSKLILTAQTNHKVDDEDDVSQAEIEEDQSEDDLKLSATTNASQDTMPPEDSAAGTSDLDILAAYNRLLPPSQRVKSQSPSIKSPRDKVQKRPTEPDSRRPPLTASSQPEQSATAEAPLRKKRKKRKKNPGQGQGVLRPSRPPTTNQQQMSLAQPQHPRPEEQSGDADGQDKRSRNRRRRPRRKTRQPDGGNTPPSAQ